MFSFVAIMLKACIKSLIERKSQKYKIRVNIFLAFFFNISFLTGQVRGRYFISL